MRNFCKDARDPIRSCTIFCRCIKCIVARLCHRCLHRVVADPAAHILRRIEPVIIAGSQTARIVLECRMHEITEINRLKGVFLPRLQLQSIRQKMLIRTRREAFQPRHTVFQYRSVQHTAHIRGQRLLSVMIERSRQQPCERPLPLCLSAIPRKQRAPLR